MAYNMAQITLSYALDFYCLYRIDPTSLSSIDPNLRGLELVFECFYQRAQFLVLWLRHHARSHTGEGGDAVEVVTAFSTVIFLLSDFVSMKESMRRKTESPSKLCPATAPPESDPAPIFEIFAAIMRWSC
jgi:hypothetical protein